MTIEEELNSDTTSAAPAPAPQAAIISSSGDGVGGSTDIESLVRVLAEQARKADERSEALSERISLLEGGNGRYNNNTIEAEEGAISRPRRFSRVVSFKGNNNSTRDNNNISTSKLNVVTGVPEDNDDIEEAFLDDRITLIERRLESYEEEKAINDDDQKYGLSESTFSLLVTHHPLSVPFAFAVFSVALSISCLCLTLASSISKGVKGNPLAIPAGVDSMVRAAQFLGALVGVLMEDEIPQGLQLIANAAGHTLLLNGRKPVQKRVLISSIFRLIVGYLFLSSLFINIAQNNDVIEIFYDVLALEFVENIDDTTFALAKRGFFGKSLLMATNEKYNLQIAGMRGSVVLGGSTASVVNERRLSFSGMIASNNRVNHIVRILYFLNAAIILIGLGYITQNQRTGHYRPNAIKVLFDEVIWEDANVLLDDGSIEQRLLIYSYFNGVYRGELLMYRAGLFIFIACPNKVCQYHGNKEDGTYNGYPRYVEQLKNDGTAFGPSSRHNNIYFGPSSRPGAELIYCHDIGRWVFMHQDILTSPDGKDENECSWLWRSAQTDGYDILSTSDGAWEAWVGKVEPLVQVSITSVECSDESDCNYHGKCVKSGNGISKAWMYGKCVCEDSWVGYSCEHELPCPSLASEKAHDVYDSSKGMQWKQENPIYEVPGHSVYNRPLYIQTGLSGEPFDLRLYKILEKDQSESPSSLPSYSPSISNEPTTPRPSNAPTLSPTALALPGLTRVTEPPTSVFNTEADEEYDPGGYTDNYPYPPAPAPEMNSPFPTGPVHTQNEYDEAPDFADWDDFFESTSLHDLDDILEDYSVVISYSGSRFYGTIIESDASLDNLFPQDYHAFWSQSFDVNRTFIISDTTYSSTPVGVDFFEMRRRVNNPLLNKNVDFSYGPYGALIPLMDYEGTGFLHCIEKTPPPSVSPSSSGVPTSKPSTSPSPTDECFLVDINLLFDGNPSEISWAFNKIGDADGNLLGGVELVEESEFYSGIEHDSLKVHTVRLCEGLYEFTIRDSYGDGIVEPGYYSLISDGATIVEGGEFGPSETTMFSIPIAATKPTIITQPDLLLVDNDMDVDVNVDVDNTATQEVEVEDKDGDATTQEELLATFNDITDQQAAESDDVIEEEIEDVTIEFPSRTTIIPEEDDPDEQPFN